MYIRFLTFRLLLVTTAEDITFFEFKSILAANSKWYLINNKGIPNFIYIDIWYICGYVYLHQAEDNLFVSLYGIILLGRLAIASGRGVEFRSSQLSFYIVSASANTGKAIPVNNSLGRYNGEIFRCSELSKAHKGDKYLFLGIVIIL